MLRTSLTHFQFILLLLRRTRAVLVFSQVKKKQRRKFSLLFNHRRNKSIPLQLLCVTHNFEWSMPWWMSLERIWCDENRDRLFWCVRERRNAAFLSTKQKISSWSVNKVDVNRLAVTKFHRKNKKKLLLFFHPKSLLKREENWMDRAFPIDWFTASLILSLHKKKWRVFVVVIWPRKHREFLSTSSAWVCGKKMLKFLKSPSIINEISHSHRQKRNYYFWTTVI